MERLYIEHDNARITRCDGDFRVNVELQTGELFETLEARRLFPTSDPDKYITLLNEEGKEVAVIRDLATLTPDSAAAVREVLKEYYLIPRIRTITKTERRSGSNYIHAETDRGPCFFKIQSRQQDIKVLFDRRVLIRDSNDNRYEIPDFRALDRKSRDAIQL